MSRTDLDAATLANSLRMRAGDGSIEWVSEPIQASVLLDIADMLDENARLKQELEAVGTAAYLYGRDDLKADNAKLRELVRDIYVDMWHCGEWLEPYEQRMQELGIEVDG